MNFNERTWASQLIEKSKTHAEWIATVRFGLPTLLTRPEFLFHLIDRESSRVASDEREMGRELSTSEAAAKCMDDIGVTFAMTNMD